MESGGSMSHSRGLSINAILSRINPIPTIDTYLQYCPPIYALAFLKVSSVGLPVKVLKALLPSSILTTRPTHLNLLPLIALTILG